MRAHIQLSTGEYLHFVTGLPPGYNGSLLKGASVIHAHANAVLLTIQEFLSEFYSIRFYSGRFGRKIGANGTITRDGFYSHFMLGNGIRKSIERIGKIHLREEQYSFYYTPSAACNVLIERESEFRVLDIFYSPRLIEELLPVFPHLTSVLERREGLVLNERTAWMMPSMMEITRQLLDCPFDETMGRFYFDLKVRELLYHLLEESSNRKPVMRFTPWEIKKIHDARQILEQHIDLKPPSIRKLSRMVALNEFKLKAGFRQYFSAGMFEWLMDQKMQRARKLLLETNRPVKEICALVGYPRTTNFITAFKRRFGVTPGSLRR